MMRCFVTAILLLSTHWPVLADDFSACGLTPQAQKLAQLIIESPAQQRAELTCNPLLARIAQDKAMEMAELIGPSHPYWPQQRQSALD